MHLKPRVLCATLASLSIVPSASTAFASSQLEEVVVTAQRKAESLQDAAIAIEAVTGEGLQKSGITNAYELSKAIPALTITSGGGGASALYIRGVGNRTTSAYIDPAVALSYDGVFMGRASSASGSSFYDLERVEVLKGPQGTLYGRNATGGAINVLPAKPVIGETSGFATFEVGTFDTLQIQAGANVALGDNTALRVAGNSKNRDGYNDDGTSDDETSSFRLQLLTEPTEQLTIRIGADYTDIGGVGSGANYTGNYVSQGLGDYTLVESGLSIDAGMLTDESNAYRTTLLGAPGFGFLTAIQDDWYVDSQFYGVNAEITYNTGNGTLTFIPAWRKSEQDSKFGVPGFNSGWFTELDEQTSLELRFSSNIGSMIDYIAGAYYIEETIDGDNTFNQEYVLPLQDFTQDSESLAAFTQFTWNIADDFRLVTGARYTQDDKTMQGSINNYITFCGGPPPSLVTPPDSFALGCATEGNLPVYPTLDTVAETDAWLSNEGWAAAFIPVFDSVTVIPLTSGVGTVLHINTETNDSYSESELTYRLAMEWDVAEDSMIYASFETGYRSGGFQLAAAPTYAPEYLDAFTIGSKNRFFDNTLQLNAELFYWEYEDQQISYFTLADGVLENLTDNVGSATSKGFDIDAIWLAGEYTTLNFKAQYLKATYDDLHFESAPPRDNINCPSSVVGATDDGTPILDFDCSGNQAVFSPELTLGLGIEQVFILGDLQLAASLNSKWVDDQVSGFWNLEHEKIDAYTTTDLTLTLEPSNAAWSVSAFALNLEDKRRIEATQASPMGMAMTTYGAPLTYGLRLGINF